MEEVYRFPLLRLKPSDASPPFVIPAKTGIQRRTNGKTAEKPRGNAIKRIVPDLDSRLRGNDGKRDCVETRIPKKFIRDDLFDLVAVYPLLLQEAHPVLSEGRGGLVSRSFHKKNRPSGLEGRSGFSRLFWIRTVGVISSGRSTGRCRLSLRLPGRDHKALVPRHSFRRVRRSRASTDFRYPPRCSGTVHPGSRRGQRECF